MMLRNTSKIVKNTHTIKNLAILLNDYIQDEHELFWHLLTIYLTSSLWNIKHKTSHTYGYYV